MRVALAQTDSDLGDTEANLRKAKEVVAEAKDRDADLTVFPELSLSGYALGELGDDVPIEAHSKPISSLADAAGEMMVKEARLALLARELNRLAEEGGDL